ncbi:MAG: MoaD/ThiS family protein [Rhodospirillales bacterium]|nr:MoaD/ThiS family protein [Rhodospirillales bacterium]
MKITLKLYAALGEYLPDHAVRNEAEIEISSGTALLDVLKDHGVPPEHCHLVLVNGIYAAPSERAEKVLEEGDALAVWPPVAGG